MDVILGRGSPRVNHSVSAESARTKKKAVKASRLFKQSRDPELEALIKKVKETL